MSRAAAEILVDRMLGHARPPEVVEIVTGVYRRRVAEAQTDVAALESYVGELLGALVEIGDAAGAPWDEADPTEDNLARVLAAIQRGR